MKLCLTPALLLPALLIPAACLSEPPASVPTLPIVTAGRAPGMLDESLRNETTAAIERALDWLAARQKDDGSWSNPRFPALTALAARAFATRTDARSRQVTGKAVRFILSCARDDGGIYCDLPGQKGGGLSNYNTAICMTTLAAVGDPALTPTILKARSFLAGTQHFGADDYRGGFGYDAQTQRAYTDLLNTYYAIEAMHATAGAEDSRPKSEKKADIDWTETVRYIERMQNPPSAGTNEAGGFFYKPGESKAGTTTNSEGRVVLRSFGSMTYAGLLALVYANVTRDDVRVRSAFDWATKHWSLEENPGMGQEGLYFFYFVLGRGLAAYGQDLIPVPADELLNWRAEVARKLVGIQKVDPATGHGYWVNGLGRFWENDAVLTTSYATLALMGL
ncbi:MAG: terpene cyclase/mutase family protein [Lentisphaerae bacterium]|nr:terpene cyclase/mutase family protein [Lentisphaerota bacterium]